MGKVTGGKALYGAAVGILTISADSLSAKHLVQAGIGAAAGLPVYSMYNFAIWFQSALAPRRVPPHRGQSMKGGIDPYESPSRGRGLSFPGRAA